MLDGFAETPFTHEGVRRELGDGFEAIEIDERLHVAG